MKDDFHHPKKKKKLVKPNFKILMSKKYRNLLFMEISIKCRFRRVILKLSIKNKNFKFIFKLGNKSFMISKSDNMSIV